MQIEINLINGQKILSNLIKESYIDEYDLFKFINFDLPKLNKDNILVHNNDKPAILFNNGYAYLQNGVFNRIDGYALIFNFDQYQEKSFFVNNKYLRSINFAIETNHLICNFCGCFCKQQCFF